MALATHAIALNYASVSYMVPLGVSAAAAVSVGHAIAAGNLARARRAGWLALGIGTGFMLVAAIAFSSSVSMSARAEESEKNLPTLAAALKDTKVNLEDGRKASERESKPVSAEFEIDDGKLQLSVYTTRKSELHS